MAHTNFFQMQILRELLFKPNSRFTDLNISGLTSDHFTYHIKSLIKSGLVKKNSAGRYILTSKGKEQANTMDTDALVIEKQPKVAVMLIPEKLIRGQKHLLVQTRLKEPYYGYNGFLTGKIKFGEKILEAAERELLEETGLKAKFELRCLHRDLVFSTSGNLLEDKLFHIIRVYKIQGRLRNFEGGKNQWVPEKNFKTLEKKYYSEDDIYSACINPPVSGYIEKIYEIEDF